MDKTLDLDELERVAREATQGEWVSFDRDTASNIYSAGNNGSLLAVCHSYTTDVSEKRPNAARRKANATYIATFDPPTILTLIAAARRPEAEISVPDMPGQFDGDIWFGDPVKRNLGTHRWQDGEWTELPSEMESVLDLLAVRTAQLEAARRPEVISDEMLAAANAMLDDYQTSDQHHPAHVLVSRTAFEAMRAAVALLSPGQGEREGSAVAESAAGDASHLTASETPCKSEGVAEDPTCTDCGGTGITYQTERRCACTLTDEERQSWQDIREGMNR